MRITSLAVRRRLATTAIVVALTVLGLYGLWRLPVDLLPDVTYPVVKVTVWWRGATPEEIDRSIADPIERQMATVDRLDSLESSSIEGMYQLDVNFGYGTDVDVAYQDVVAAMGRATRRLPDDIEPPLVFKADPSQLPVLQIIVSSDEWDLVRLRDWADQWLQDQLLAVPGVAGSDVAGGMKREVRVLLDPVAMEKHRVALSTVLNRLSEENVEQFGGRVYAGRQEVIARTMGEFRDLEEIRSVVLCSEGGANLYMRDIAEVVDGHEEARVVSRLDGVPSVRLSVFKQAEANTVEVARAVRAKLDEIAPALPSGLRTQVVEDQAVYVQDALAGVRNAAIQAAVLLILVIYLFLGSFRQVLVMVAALPLTLLLNFGLMNLGGFSLNIFTLGGLVVSIGVVLDTSIVVMESVSRRRRERPEEDADAHAVEGAAEVGPPIVAAVFSFLALFAPFLMVPGLTTLLFRELVLVMSGIVAISLGVAVTVTPMLTAALFGGERRARAAGRFERFFDGLADRYARALGWFLKRRWWVLAGFVVALGMAWWVSGRLGAEFLPQVDDGRVMVRLRMPTGTSLAETNSILRRIEENIGDDPLIESLSSIAGGRVRGYGTLEMSNEGSIDIQLVPRGERDITTAEYVQRLRPVVTRIPAPGGRIMASQRRIRGVKGMSGADVEVKVRGAETAVLFDLASEATRRLRNDGAFENVDVSLDYTKPEYRVIVDRVRAADLGVSVRDVAGALRSLITGSVATQYRDRGEYYDVRVLVPEERIVSREAVERLPVTRADGNAVRVRDLARVQRAVGPVELVREDQVKQVLVRADGVNASVAASLASARQILEEVDRPVGYEFSYGGQAEMMGDMGRTVLAVLGFALFFSFVVLAVQFDSLRLPLLVFAGAPFSLGGVAILLWITGLPFGATVIIGMLVVIAATVNDGVLLLTYAEDSRRQSSASAADAVREAARVRLRPRVMTTMTTMAGFLPLALNLGGGGEMLQPMAVAAMGGLAMEMAVALFLIPCLYILFTRSPRSQPE